MLACVVGSMLWMNNWQVQSFRTLDSHRTAIKTSELARRKTLFSFKIPIHNFHENNSFHLNSIRCKLRHRCHDYRRRTTTKTQVFASVQNSYRTSQLVVEMHSFLSKCWFTIFHEHSKSFHFNCICKLQTLASILCRHRPNFRVANFLIFFQSVCDLQTLHPWHIIPRAPHGFTHD